MIGSAALVILGLAMTIPSSAFSGIESRGVGRGQIARMIRVEHLGRDGNTLRMHLVNLTTERLEHVRVLVTESFRWKDEQHPGADDPSRAVVVTVPDRIAPGGTVDATFTLAPLPARDDGWFVLGATVIGLEAYPDW